MSIHTRRGVVAFILLSALASARAADDPPALTRDDLLVREGQPWYWHRFARLDYRTPGGTPVVDVSATACIPRLMNADTLPASNAPATRPSQRLVLALDGETLVVRSEGAGMVSWPDWYLLARWWVNGKPVPAARPAEERPVQFGRQVSVAREFRLPFGPPGVAGGLRPGDELTLQLLYAPHGVRELPQKESGMLSLVPFGPREDSARSPMLSNKVSVRLTERMIRGGP